MPFRTFVGDWCVRGWASYRQGEALLIWELTVTYTPVRRLRASSKGSGWVEIRKPATITGTVLGQVRPSVLADEIRRALLIEYDIDELPGQPYGTRLRPGTTEALRPKRSRERGRPGRKPIPPDQLEALAGKAVQLSESGVTPLRPALAEAFGVPVETIRDWLHKAREQRWLAPWIPGQKQQLPGPMLLAKEEQSK